MTATRPDQGAHLIISTPSRDEILLNLQQDQNLLGLYQVCGRHPWLLVWNLPTLDEGLPLTKKYGLSARFISFAPKQYRTQIGGRAPGHDVLVWFLLGGDRSALDDLVKHTERDIGISPLLRYDNVVGEYPTILKVAARDVPTIETFLSLCGELSISASTKCVLNELKDDGPASTSRSSSTNLTKLKRDPEYAAARVMANHGSLLALDGAEQRQVLRAELTKLGCSNEERTLRHLVLTAEDTGGLRFWDDLIHKNRFIERYSLVLDRPGWLRALVKVKVKPGPDHTSNDANKKIRRLLEADFLGVSETHFARKIYHMTGEFDFVIPLDCLDLPTLDAIIRDFQECHPDLIESLITVLCTPRPGSPTPLRPVEVQLVSALLTNSTGITDFEARAKELVLSPVRDEPMHVPREHEEGVSPREDRVCLGLRDIPSDGQEQFVKEFHTLRSIGVRPVPDFSNATTFRVLVRFDLAKVEQQPQFLAKIGQKTKARELIARIYQPMRDRSSILAIIVAADLRELSMLFDKLRGDCRRIEFHMLFQESRYTNPLPDSLRCRPCVVPTEDLDGGRPVSCSTCIAYVLPRFRKRIIALPSPIYGIKEEAKVTVVGINLTLAQYVLSDAYFDIRGRSDDLFARYENYFVTNEAVRAFVPTPDQLRSEYQASPLPSEFRATYYRALRTQVAELLADHQGPDLIVLPEYAVPRELAVQLADLPSTRPVILVAGSHLHMGYNVCPVVFKQATRRDIFPLYKVYRSPFEEHLGTMTHRGTASLRFDDTPLGSLLVQLCYDGFKLERHPEIDVFAVPSWNHSAAFRSNFAEGAAAAKSVVAYANTTDGHGINSEILTPPDHGRRATPNDVKPRRADSGLWTTTDLFAFEPRKRVTVEGHQFDLQTMSYDPRQLDARRGIRSRNEVPR